MKKRQNKVKNKLPEKWQGFVVKGINKSPLLERLKDQKKVKESRFS